MSELANAILASAVIASCVYVGTVLLIINYVGK